MVDGYGVRRPEQDTNSEARVIQTWTRVLSGFTPIYVVFCLLVLASAPSYGWWVAVLIGLDVAKGAIAHTIASNGYRVEMVYNCNQFVGVVLIGATVFASGGVGSPFLPFLAAFAGLFPILFEKSRALMSFGFLITVTVVASLGPEQVADYEGLFRIGTMVCLILALWVFGADLLNSGLEYRAESLIDELTGLRNRRSFDAGLEAIGESLVEQPGSAALIICDIDHFKNVNDTHGHSTGDRVLREIGAALDGAFRSEDTAFRIGGEEFAFIVNGVAPFRAEGMANTLRGKIRSLQPAGLQISMSFGVAMHTEGETNQAWLDRADDALYEAKHAGRNRVEVAPS